MTTYDEHIDDLILHFAKGDISKEGLLELNEFIHQSEVNRCYIRDTRELYFDHVASSRETKQEFDPEKAILRFLAYTGKEEDIMRNSTPRKVDSFKRIIQIAAIIILLLLPFAAYHYGVQHIHRKFAAIEVSVPEGSQLAISLPDSSQVRLNSGSTIRYSQGFGITDRKLFLEGEGFFDVRHNEQMPLTVETHGVVVHDLGTAFKVSNYREDTNIDIRLYEGKLSLYNTPTKRNGISMSPGEEVLINKATGKFLRQRMNESIGEGASMNILYFDNKPLRTVAQALSRSYGIHVKVAKTAENKHVYLIVNRKANTIDDLLLSLQKTGHIKYKKITNGYLLY